MQILEGKRETLSEEKKDLNFISYNSKKTLTIAMKDGTYFNFNGDEAKILINFVSGL